MLGAYISRNPIKRVDKIEELVNSRLYRSSVGQQNQKKYQEEDLFWQEDEERR